jgi:general secretion pathway protein N
MSSRVRRSVAIVAAGLAGAALVLLTLAPADLAAGAVRSWSEGRVELDDPSGTVWNGAADLVLTDGNRTAPLRTRLPGRTTWRLDPWRLLTGSVHLDLANSALLDAPLALRMDRAGNATIDPDRLRLPAAVLAGLGAPWNTIRPGGEIELAWDTLHVEPDALRGQLRAEWKAASSGLSPVAPFGHYRLQAEGIFPGALVQLDTVSGPMEMVGNGTIGNGRHLRFRGTARVQPGTDATVATQLSGLISLLGRRDAEGDGAILDVGN